MRKITALAVCAAIVPLAGGGAAAQAPADRDALPEIVVTAERRATGVQTTPLAISVVDGRTLAERGVVSINQLQYQTPGLEAVPAFGGGQPNFRLRGVGFDDYASNNASPVGGSVDEVAKPFPIQTQGLLFDLDRVEVVRGPQGTLYGRNTTAGAINFITARPTDRLAAGIDADYGSFGLFRGEAYLSGPLGGGWAGRIAAGTEQGGGFQHDRSTGRALGDADRVGTRGELAYGGGALSLLVEGHYGRDRSDATGLYLFQPLGAIAADTSRRATGWGASPQFAGLLGIPPDAKPFRDNATAGGSLHAEFDLGSARLTGVTGYEHFRRREYNDWDASPLAFAGTYFASRARTFSQEVRLASTSGAATRWIVGVYYGDERLADRFDSDFQQSLTFVALTSYRQNARTIAGFGQVDVPLTPELTLTGGLRVEHERRTLRDFTTTTLPVFGLGVAGGAASLSYTEPSGKVALAWTARPRTLLYASASRGVKSGGFTAYNTLTPSQLAPFRPEILYAYEAGAKTELGGRLRLNVAGFYYDYHRQQVQSAIYDPVYMAVGKIVNAPRSHIYGAEAELTWAPLHGLTIVQGLAWRVGKFDRFDDLDIAASTAAGTGVTVSRSGQDEGFAHWSYTGSASYRAGFGRYDLTAQTDYAYRGPNEPVLLGPLFRVHDYVLVNVTLTVGPHGGPWSVGVYGRNLLNQGYDLTRNFFLAGIDVASPGRPRSFGVRGRYAF